jgi:hypothetical protein
MHADPKGATLRALRCWLVVCLFSQILPGRTLRASQEGSLPLPVLERTSGGIVFRWDLEKDNAELRVQQAAKPFWQGPLLPSFWLKGATGDRQFIKAKAIDIPGGDRHLLVERKLGQSPEDKHGEVALVPEGKGRGLFWALVAWDAYARLFDSFGPFPAGRAIHQQGHWNSWGTSDAGKRTSATLRIGWPVISVCPSSSSTTAGRPLAAAGFPTERLSRVSRKI